MAILDEAARLVKQKLGDIYDDLTIERSVVGLFFTGVKLSNGAGGICLTPIKEIPEAVCCPSSAGRIFDPGTISGMKAADALSALSSPEPMFERGVRVVGGVWVKKPDELLDVLASGGSGYHFLDRLADRIVIEK